MQKRTFNRNSKVDVYEKIKNYLTREQVDAAKFAVHQMTITSELADILIKYIKDERLETFSQYTKNNKSVTFIYTANFSIKKYSSMCLIDNGTRGDKYQYESPRESYSEKSQRTMTRLDLYCSIIKKYPSHLIDVRFSTNEND